MTSLSPCPDTERVRRLLAGELVGSDHQQVEAHIRECLHCRQRVGGTDPSVTPPVGPIGDTLGTMAIRAAGVTPGVESSTLALPDQTLEPVAESGPNAAPA